MIPTLTVSAIAAVDAHRLAATASVAATARASGCPIFMDFLPARMTADMFFHVSSAVDIRVARTETTRKAAGPPGVRSVAFVDNNVAQTIRVRARSSAWRPAA